MDPYSRYNYEEQDVPPTPRTGPFTPPSLQKKTAGKAPLIDLTQVPTTDWLIAGGSVVMIIGSLLSWTTYNYLNGGRGFTSVSIIGWDSTLGKATTIIGVLVLILFALRFFQVQLPFKLPATDRAIYIGLSAEALFLSVLYIFNPTGVPIFGNIESASPSYGLFLVLVASVATLAGGFFHAPRKR
jgi:hypothetical protein